MIAKGAAVGQWAVSNHRVGGLKPGFSCSHVKVSLGRTLMPRLLPVRPALCMVAYCHWCVRDCEWENERQNCKALWITVQYKCRPFTKTLAVK